MGNSFGTNLAEIRRERGLSQRQAAQELKVSQALLSHYENEAREPGIPFICRVCEYYGISADYLLGRDTERTSEIVAISQLIETSEKTESKVITAAVNKYLRAVNSKLCSQIRNEINPTEFTKYNLKMAEAENEILKYVNRNEEI